MTPPPDLLERCLSTIPASATYRPAAPRPRPDGASRKRLLWLGVAAAVPVITVLAVLPAKRWFDARNSVRSQNIEQKTEPKIVTPPRSLQLVPYARIEGWARTAGNGVINPPEYRVIIYDKNRGRSEWVTDSTYTTINDSAPFTLLQIKDKPDSKTYTSYYRSRKKCLVKTAKVTTQDGLDGYSWAYNIGMIGQSEGQVIMSRKAQVDTSQWDGKTVRRYTFNSITTAEQKMLRDPARLDAIVKKYADQAQKKLKADDTTPKEAEQTKKNLESMKRMLNSMKNESSPPMPKTRCEVYVDADSGRVVGARTWAFFKIFAQSDPNGVQVGESHFSYDPRLEDGKFFDVERIKRGAKIMPNKSKYLY